jgi:hypothetical protein
LKKILAHSGENPGDAQSGGSLKKAKPEWPSFQRDGVVAERMLEVITSSRALIGRFPAENPAITRLVTFSE